MTCVVRRKKAVGGGGLVTVRATQQAIEFSRSEIKLSVDGHAHFTRTIMAIGELI